jgi:TRAP-type C4-dicarboxylate transport system substrate-binding protein
MMRIGAVGALLLLGTATHARADERRTVRIATLAPENSSFGLLLHEWATAIEAHVPLRFEISPNGEEGDEDQFATKLRSGKIDGAILTDVGFARLQPELRAFELPLLFRNYEELDTARRTLDDDIRKLLSDAGLVRLAWSDSGPAHLFSGAPFSSATDLAALKHWAWSFDPVGDAFLKRLGSPGASLEVYDLARSLQSGRINALLGTPLVILALRLFTSLKYVTATPVAMSIGALVIRKQTWEALSKEAQRVLLEQGRVLEGKLLANVRENNAKALRVLAQSGGLTAVELSPVLQGKFESAAQSVAPQFDTKIYSPAFRRRLEAAVAEARKPKTK